MLKGDFCKGSELSYRNLLSDPSRFCWRWIQPNYKCSLPAGALLAALRGSGTQLGSSWLRRAGDPGWPLVAASSWASWCPFQKCLLGCQVGCRDPLGEQGSFGSSHTRGSPLQINPSLSLPPVGSH